MKATYLTQDRQSIVQQMIKRTKQKTKQKLDMIDKTDLLRGIAQSSLASK